MIMTAKGGISASLFLLLLLCIALLHLSIPTLSAVPPFSCGSFDPSTKNYHFCNQKLPVEQRAEDLVSRLSLEEKIAQLGDVAPSIPRLGVPAYKWWSEGLHGVAGSGRGIHFNGSIHSATSFPQVILTAATFNPHLWYRIGKVIGTEARAIYNAGQAEGLTFWSPNINIFRDPRWGRGQETPGEDTTLTSLYAVSFVRGLQGDAYRGGRKPQGLQASACCKHYTAYDLENWKGINRFIFDAKVSAQDLEEIYQPPFKRCVEEGRASGMMCSYNRVNGVPACASYDFLTKTARKKWGFDGYIVSDCDAVSVMYTDQNYTKTPEDAVALVFKAGMDLNCGKHVQKYGASAVQKGKLSEDEINRALHNLFAIRMRLGLFSGNPKNRIYGNINPNIVCNEKHQSLALEAARDGIVLLKNLDNILPLSQSRVASLGVSGPNANNLTALQGNYFGPPCKLNTPLQVLKGYVNDTRYVSGCDTVGCTSYSIAEAVELAESVDYVVLFMGLDQTQEKEDLDRVDLVLPGMQRSLITSVAKAAKRPVILVMLCGGPVDITFAKNDPKIGAILWAGYPGEAGGLAIAEVLFGEHNPGGRLPVTWYPQSFTSVPMTDMRMRADAATGYPGRTYRFYTGKPVFKFGHGLSYSTFSYEFKSTGENTIYMNKSIGLQAIKKSDDTSCSITDIASACEKLKFSTYIEVKNDGLRAGRHSVLLFLRQSGTINGRPMTKLIGFKSVHLEAGEGTAVEFIMSPCEHLSRTKEDGSKLLEEGSQFLIVGDKEHQINILA